MKVRFIHDVINEHIIIYKQKKATILQTLIERKYLQVKDKMVLPEDAKYLPSNYDYLIKMSLYAFTEEEIMKLETEMQKLQEQYNALEKKTIEEIFGFFIYYFSFNIKKHLKILFFTLNE